jgi:hypothetical protein
VRYLEFVGLRWIGLKATTPVDASAAISFVNALITIVIWEFFLRRMKYNEAKNIKDGLWNVIIWAKFVQGAIGIVLIPLTLLSIWANLPSFYEFALTLKLKWPW